jgi:hypothetical protein
MTTLTNREKAIEVAICTFFAVDGEDNPQKIYDLLELACVREGDQMFEIIDCYLDIQKNETYVWEPFEGKTIAFMWEHVNYVVDHIVDLFGD